jgi:hypothetical protein
LLKEYQAAGEFVRPTDQRTYGALFPEGAAYERWWRVEWELVRRGPAIVPELMELLKQEVPRNAGADDRGSHFGLARPVMELLARIRDPRPAPLLVDVLDGFGGSANPPLREAALDALAALTYTSFDVIRPQGRHHGVVQHDSVVPPGTGEIRAAEPPAVPAGPPAPGAVPVAPPAAPGAVPPAPPNLSPHAERAARYRQWLAGEGKDPARWLPLAQERARKLLEGDDLEAAYCAVVFFHAEGGQGRFPRDDDPGRTLRRIGQILRDAQESRGTNLPLGLGNWTMRLQWYGPLAVAHVQTLLRLHARDDKAHWGLEACLADVGGEEAVAHVPSRLPALDRRLAEAGLDARVDWDEVQHKTLRQVALANHVCRWTLHRWSGRTFADTAEARRWWEANRHRGQEQWLSEGLHTTAARADAGDPQSQYLLRRMLPDLPPSDGEPVWCPAPTRFHSSRRVKPEQPFRVKWLKENRPNLRYDADSGAFRLPAGNASR